MIDVWIKGDFIKSGDIIINYPDGKIPVRTQFQNTDDSFFDYIALPVLIIENLLFVILILVAVAQSKKDEPQKKMIEPDKSEDGQNNSPQVLESTKIDDQKVEDLQINSVIEAKKKRTKISNYSKIKPPNKDRHQQIIKV